MAAQSRFFAYEKSIVINALYDTIEALGLCLKSVNSARGTLIVSDDRHTAWMRIGLSPAEAKGQTQVSVYPEASDKGFYDTWNTVILDELLGTINRARHNARIDKGEEA